MLRRSDLSFRQEMKFRNQLVDYLTDWVLHTQDERQHMTQEVRAISWLVHSQYTDTAFLYQEQTTEQITGSDGCMCLNLLQCYSKLHHFYDL